MDSRNSIKLFLHWLLRNEEYYVTHTHNAHVNVKTYTLFLVSLCAYARTHLSLVHSGLSFFVQCFCGSVKTVRRCYDRHFSCDRYVYDENASWPLCWIISKRLFLSLIVLTPHRVCNRELPCGHRCKQPCHAGECPSCPLQAVQECACGAERKLMPCRYDKNSFHHIVAWVWGYPIFISM